MLPPKAFFDTLSKQAANLLNANQNSSLPELEAQLKALLQSTFSKFELVSRDEFEAQMLVLKRTRAKLEQLEAKVQQLEQQE